MSSLISNICTGIRVMCEAANLVERANRISAPVNMPEESNVRAVSIANRTFLLAITTAEQIAIAKGASTSTLKSIKTAEIISRVVDLPLKNMETAMEQPDSPHIILEKGVVAPIVSLVRAINEGGIYRERRYLEMSPEELSLQYRIIRQDPEDISDVVREPVTRESAQNYLNTYQTLDPILKLGEVATISGSVNKAVSLSKQLYQTLNHWVRAQRGIPMIEEGPVYPANAEEFPDPLDLRSFPRIPDPLHNDEVFKLYICPITSCPIRHPVGDPNGRGIYEKDAILRWIDRRGTSPLTRRPLSRDDLVAKPAVQAIINDRLAYHEQQLRALATTASQAPANPALQTAADAEQPR